MGYETQWNVKLVMGALDALDVLYAEHSIHDGSKVKVAPVHALSPRPGPSEAPARRPAIFVMVISFDACREVAGCRPSPLQRYKAPRRDFNART